MTKTKKCPKCSKELGQRTRTCACGHKFSFVKKIKNPKKCPQCFIDLKPRARKCKCGYEYPKKNKKKFEEIVDWKKLKDGSIIYLKKTSRGPYYKGENGPILMAYRGKFIVKQIHKEGIVGYSSSTGWAYIYMGKKKYIESTGIYRRPHRIYKKI